MMQLEKNRITANRLLALGALLAALLASMMLVTRPVHASTTFTVNSTGDKNDLDFPGGVFDGSLDGKCFTGDVLVVQGEECTLRAAIQESNKTPGADTIEFDIPGTGVHHIAPLSQLPTVTGPVTINGYSQPGAQPSTKAVGSDAVLNVQLSGAKAMGADGLVIGGANTTVKGLAINNWSYAGVRIDGSGAMGNRIAGNFIGTDASGTNAMGNGLGVRVYEGSNDTIGGTMVAARNVISGNVGLGVGIGDGVPNIMGNKVVGNYIGTDATGTKALGNGSDGISIEDLSGTRTNTIIGGTTAGERNVISGNDDSGVGFFGSGNRVIGNYVGSDATGTKDLGNGDDGVTIDSVPDNIIGGTTAGERNVISGNQRDGIYIDGSDATGNRIQGNYIGTDKNGTASLGNFAVGILISGPSNNTIGGRQAEAGNVIAANGRSPGYEGVSIYGDGATGNRILSNSIHSNGGIGIDLAAEGRTPNDPGDADTGANYLQNFPILSSARKNAAGTTTVKGTLDSTSNSTFRLQFFSNPKDMDEGKTLLGSGTVSTDGSGKVSFTFPTKKAITLGQNITATATGPGGNTSEFSAPKKVVAS